MALKINYFSSDCGTNLNIARLTAINDLYTAGMLLNKAHLAIAFFHAIFLHGKGNHTVEWDNIDTDYPELK